MVFRNKDTGTTSVSPPQCQAVVQSFLSLMPNTHFGILWADRFTSAKMCSQSATLSTGLSTFGSAETKQPLKANKSVLFGDP